MGNSTGGSGGEGNRKFLQSVRQMTKTVVIEEVIEVRHIPMQSLDSRLIRLKSHKRQVKCCPM